MRLFLCVSALIVLAFAPLACAQSGRTPGGVAYDEVQALRVQGDPMVDPKSPEATRQAIGLFEKALQILDRREVEESANGNVALKFRRFDVELDLAQAYAALGDTNAAIEHLEKSARVATLGGGVDLMLKIRPGLAPLRDDPRFLAVMQHSTAAEHLWRHPQIAVPYSDTLSAEQRLAGLSVFWQEVNDNFVHFDHVPALDWDKVYLESIPKVLAASTTRDYYDVLMRLAPLLQDAHINIYPPKELENRFYARPPLRTERIEGRVFVRAVYSAALAKRVRDGDEIVAIDGERVDDYAQTHVRPYESSSTPQDADVRAYDYGLLAGDAARPVTLTLRDARNAERTVTIARSGYTDEHRPQPAPFRDLGDGVVYFAVDGFEDDASVTAFEQALPRIRKAKALILDARDNGGGSTTYGLQILSYLTHRPIPTLHARVREYTALPRLTGMASIEWRALDAQDFVQPHKEVFEGAVALLIGPRTFSAGEDFVASFQMLQRGPLIGEPTAGSTGQPLLIDLPGGGSARICAKRDEYPDGTSFVGTGIAPEIAVPRTIADLRAHRDGALERAKSELRQRLR
ncbi:MAG TPA: S41 family peptidase [Rudaea sp.]